MFELVKAFLKCYCLFTTKFLLCVPLPLLQNSIKDSQQRAVGTNTKEQSTLNIKRKQQVLQPEQSFAARPNLLLVFNVVAECDHDRFTFHSFICMSIIIIMMMKNFRRLCYFWYHRVKDLYLWLSILML